MTRTNIQMIGALRYFINKGLSIVCHLICVSTYKAFWFTFAKFASWFLLTCACLVVSMKTVDSVSEYTSIAIDIKVSLIFARWILIDILVFVWFLYFSRAVGYRFGPHLSETVPLLISYCKSASETDEELREHSLQVLLLVNLLWAIPSWVKLSILLCVDSSFRHWRVFYWGAPGI